MEKLPAPRVSNCRGTYVVHAEPAARISDCVVQGTIFIGFSSYIGSGVIRSHCEIGRYCSIGRDVSIGLGHHDYRAFSTSPWFRKKGKPTMPLAQQDPIRRVVIGHDVWIGDGCKIVSGVRIGHGAVIGAGSVVTKDVPDYEIVAGVPARSIRRRFDDDIVSRLSASQWWQLDPFIVRDMVRDDLLASLERVEGIDRHAHTFGFKYIKIRSVEVPRRKAGEADQPSPSPAPDAQPPKGDEPSAVESTSSTSDLPHKPSDT